MLHSDDLWCSEMLLRRARERHVSDAGRRALTNRTDDELWARALLPFAHVDIDPRLAKSWRKFVDSSVAEQLSRTGVSPDHVARAHREGYGPEDAEIIATWANGSVESLPSKADLVHLAAAGVKVLEAPGHAVYVICHELRTSTGIAIEDAAFLVRRGNTRIAIEEAILATGSSDPRRIQDHLEFGSGAGVDGFEGHGLTAQEIRALRGNRVKPEEFAAWKRLGLASPRDIVSASATWKPDEAKKWTVHLRCTMTEALQWRDTCRTLEMARTWRDLVVTPDEAAAFKAAGITPSEATGWRNLGVSGEAAVSKELRRWKLADARAWSGWELDEAFVWRESRMSPDQARLWKGIEIAPETARKLANAGLRPETVEKLLPVRSDTFLLAAIVERGIVDEHTIGQHLAIWGGARELNTWAESFGDDIAQALVWRSTRWRCADAVTLWKAAVTADDARAFVDCGVGTATDVRLHAAAWRTPAELAQWMSEIRIDAASALEWRKAGLGLHAAVQWHALGCPPKLAAVLEKKAGWSPFDVPSSFDFSKVDHALIERAAESKFPIDVVEQWKANLGDDFTLLLEWFLFEPELHRAVQWKSAAGTIDNASAWRKLGLPMVDVQALIAAGMTASEVEGFRSLGVSQVHQLRQHHRAWSHQQATEWCHILETDAESGLKWFETRRPVDHCLPFIHAEVQPETVIDFTRLGVSQVDRILAHSARWTPAEAEQWVRGLGLRPEAALGWREHFHDIGTAQRWSDSGYAPVEAASFEAAGLVAAEVDGWRSMGVADESIVRHHTVWTVTQLEAWSKRLYLAADDCLAWFETGIDIDAAVDWSGLSFAPAEAAALRVAGIDAAEAAAWRAIDVVGAATIRVHRGIWKAPEATEWAGRLGTDGGTALEWRRHFTSVEAAVPWCEANVAPEHAYAWHDKGFTPTAAGEWATAGVPDPAGAHDWAQHGFDASTASNWIGAGVRAPEARSFVDAGFTFADLDAMRARLPAISALDAAWRWSVERYGLELVDGRPTVRAIAGRAVDHVGVIDRVARSCGAAGVTAFVVEHDAPELSVEVAMVLADARFLRGAGRAAVAMWSKERGTVDRVTFGPVDVVRIESDVIRRRPIFEMVD
jgi:hypothetical protein